MRAAQGLGRWLFLFGLVEAPWLYGSTRPWTIQLLHGVLLACFLLQLPAFIRDRFRRSHPLPWLPVACLGLLALQAGWMWFNARSYLDDAFWEFVPLSQPCPSLPGSWERAASGQQVQTILALLAAFLIAAGMVEETAWRERLWRTMAITGVSIVIYGLAQRALNFTSIFWPAETGGRNFFGSFHYHGNAGAFLNLIWPILLMLLVRSFRQPKAHLERALWSSALFLTLVGCMVNISRAAAAITLVLGLVGGGWLLPQARVRPVVNFRSRGFILLAVLGIFMAALVAVAGHSMSEMRWAQFSSQLNGNNQRLLAQGACLRMLPEAGWFGFGPGTFFAVFPFHTSYLGYKIWGFWIYAHEDYLQTVIEYGRVGAALWAVYFFGGLFLALVRGLGAKSAGTTARLGYAACFLALGGIALHSLVDFPLQVPSIQLYVAVYLALAWRAPVRDDRGTGSARAMEDAQPRRASTGPGR
jgi:O-antigen ligase